MVKNISFLEKKNKPLFDVELTMEYLIDDLYKNIITYYKSNNINDIILIDPRLDIWRNKLIGCKYLDKDELIGKNKYIYSFNKNNFNLNYGFVMRENNNNIYIKGKKSCFIINKKNSYIFYKNIKSKKEKDNDSIRNFLENLLNNKIKIKKVSNNEIL